MKNIIIFLLMLLPMVATAQTAVTDGTWKGVTNDDMGTGVQLSVTITGLVDNSATINNMVVPQAITDNTNFVTYTVTQMGAGAFADCANLTGDVVVPEKISTIDDAVFAGCVGLRSITFKATTAIKFVNTTGGLARGTFADDNALEFIDFSNSIGLIDANDGTAMHAILPVDFNRATVPSGTGTYTFYGLPTHTVVYLPPDRAWTPANFDFTVTPDDPMPLAYNAGVISTTYKVTSTYNDVMPVPWNVVGYDADGDGAYSMDEKPSWLTGLTNSGTGGPTPNPGTAALAANPANVDMVAEINKALKATTPVGTQANPYDLSTHNIKGVPTLMNTANCYVISAPGWYKIPMVYGNAIKDGMPNTQAYTSTATGAFVLKNFVRSDGNAVTDPYIYNNVSSGVPQTQITWSENGSASATIVNSLALVGSDSNAYMKFYVDPISIELGNAVVEVMDAFNGTLWSWHLWFTTNDALDPIPVTNDAGKQYDFASQSLGFVPTTETGALKRNVDVQIQQEGSGLLATFNISENGTIASIKGYNTLYQWGRKDPFSGNHNADNVLTGGSAVAANTTNYYPYTSVSQDAKGLEAGMGYPESFISWLQNGDGNWTYDEYCNLWSANQPGYAQDAPTPFDGPTVVKTIYDPCPVGFSVPTNDAFTGFGKTANTAGTNVTGTVDGIAVDPNATSTYTADLAGFYFFTEPPFLSGNPNTTTGKSIFFPATGGLDYTDGTLVGKGVNLYYHTAQAFNYGDECSMTYVTTSLTHGTTPVDPSAGLYTTYANNMARGQAVYPVANPN